MNAPAKPRRILIYGVTGSGKSTLAAAVANQTGLPFHPVDELSWEANWTSAPLSEQRVRIAAVCADECWILDGAYGTWLDIVLTRVDLIVGLDYPRWRSLSRLLVRTVARVVDKRPVCNGNIETLRGTFGRESIILWHFRSFRRKRDRIRHWSANIDSPPIIVLRSERQTQRWLQSLDSQST